MAKGRPKANNTTFKAGDVIMLLRDIKKDDYGAGNGSAWNWSGTKVVAIPANVPVIVEKVNNSHVWLKYKGEVHWVRNIPGRMIPATEAAIVLFGENNVK